VDAIGAARRPSTVPIADVALNGRDKKIVGQPNQLGAGGKFIQAASRPKAGNGSHRFELLTAKSLPQAVSNWLLVIPFKNRSVDGAAYLNDFRLGVTDLGGFGATLHVVPAALEPVLVLVRGIELFDKDILHVGKTGRGSPGNVVIVANQHTGNSRKAHADDVQAGAAEMNFVRNLWRGESHLRPSNEDGVAGS